MLFQAHPVTAGPVLGMVQLLSWLPDVDRQSFLSLRISVGSTAETGLISSLHYLGIVSMNANHLDLECTLHIIVVEIQVIVITLSS
jgi:hypothetical protein